MAKESTEGAALMGAAEGQDDALSAEVENCGARVEEVSDASERGEVLPHLVEHILAVDDVEGVLTIDGD